MGRFPLAYYDRIAALTYAGSAYAFTALVIAQFIYLTLKSVLGATLTVVALCSMTVQICLSIAEKWQLEHSQFNRLHRTFTVHFWLTHVFQVLYMVFILWAAIIMYQRHTVE